MIPQIPLPPVLFIHGKIIQGFIDAINALISAIVGVIVGVIVTVYSAVVNILIVLIRLTPYPKYSSGDPKLFGHPCGSPGSCDSGLQSIWGSFYQIEQNIAEPYAYVLLILATFIVLFGGIFSGTFVGNKINSEQGKRRIILTFILITLWWPLMVMYLAFVDAFTETMFAAGDRFSAPANPFCDEVDCGEINSLGMQHLADRFNSGDRWPLQMILGYFTMQNTIIVSFIDILWIIRLYFIFLGSATIPLALGMMAMAQSLPGLRDLERFAMKHIRAWFGVVFLSIPAALVAGVGEQLVGMSLAFSRDSRIPEHDSSMASPTIEGGSGSASALTDPSIGGSTTQQAATTGGDVVAGGAAPSAPFQPAISTGAAEPSLFGGFIGGYIAIYVATAIPLMAGLMPWLVVLRSTPSPEQAVKGTLKITAAGVGMAGSAGAAVASGGTSAAAQGALSAGSKVASKGAEAASKAVDKSSKASAAKSYARKSSGMLKSGKESVSSGLRSIKESGTEDMQESGILDRQNIAGAGKRTLAGGALTAGGAVRGTASGAAEAAKRSGRAMGEAAPGRLGDDWTKLDSKIAEESGQYSEQDLRNMSYKRRKKLRNQVAGKVAENKSESGELLNGDREDDISNEDELLNAVGEDNDMLTRRIIDNLEPQQIEAIKKSAIQEAAEKGVVDMGSEEFSHEMKEQMLMGASSGAGAVNEMSAPNPQFDPETGELKDESEWKEQELGDPDVLEPEPHEKLADMKDEDDEEVEEQDTTLGRPGNPVLGGEDEDVPVPPGATGTANGAVLSSDDEGNATIKADEVVVDADTAEGVSDGSSDEGPTTSEESDTEKDKEEVSDIISDALEDDDTQEQMRAIESKEERRRQLEQVFMDGLTDLPGFNRMSRSGGEILNAAKTGAAIGKPAGAAASDRLVSGASSKMGDIKEFKADFTNGEIETSTATVEASDGSEIDFDVESIDELEAVLETSSAVDVGNEDAIDEEEIEDRKFRVLQEMTRETKDANELHYRASKQNEKLNSHLENVQKTLESEKDKIEQAIRRQKLSSPEMQNAFDEAAAQTGVSREKLVDNYVNEQVDMISRDVQKNVQTLKSADAARMSEQEINQSLQALDKSWVGEAIGDKQLENELAFDEFDMSGESVRGVGEQVGMSRGGQEFRDVLDRRTDLGETEYSDLERELERLGQEIEVE